MSDNLKTVLILAIIIFGAAACEFASHQPKQCVVIRGAQL